MPPKTENRKSQSAGERTSAHAHKQTTGKCEDLLTSHVKSSMYFMIWLLFRVFVGESGGCVRQ